MFLVAMIRQRFDKEGNEVFDGEDLNTCVIEKVFPNNHERLFLFNM